MLHEPREQPTPIGAADYSLHVVFRVRHHAEHIAGLADDAGDGVGRAVDVPAGRGRAVGRAIAEYHPALALDARDGVGISDEIALAMGDRHLDHLAGIVAAGEGSAGPL